MSENRVHPRKVKALQCSLTFKIISLVALNLLWLAVLIFALLGIDVVLNEEGYRKDWQLSESSKFERALTEAFELTLIANGIDSYRLALHDVPVRQTLQYENTSPEDARAILREYYSNFIYTMRVGDELDTNDPQSFDKEGQMVGVTKEALDDRYQYCYIFNGYSVALSSNPDIPSPGPLKTDQLYVAPKDPNNHVTIWFSIDSIPQDQRNRFFWAMRSFKFITVIAPMVIPGIISCSLISVIFAIFLLGSAGYARHKDGSRPRVGEVKLSWVDNIPNDIFVVMLLLPIGVLVAHNSDLIRNMFNSIHQGDYLSFPVLRMVATSLSIMVLAEILIGSQVRRNRADILTRNTALSLLFKRSRRQWSHSGQLRLIMILGGSLLGGIVLSIVTRNWVLATLVASLCWVVAVGFGVVQTKDLNRLKRQTSAMVNGRFREVPLDRFLNVIISELAEDLNKIAKVTDESIRERTKSERLKTELISNVSHDLKTPLTTIVNYADLLGREDLPKEDRAEYQKILKSKAKQLVHLTEQLLEASKLASGILLIEPEPLELGEFLCQAVAEFEQAFHNAELDLILDLPEKGPVVIESDGKQLWRVLQNLLENCIKYAMKGTRVYVSLRLVRDKAQITVLNISATPLGVSSEDLLERFVRGDASRKAAGNGLGLSIAKNLVELLGGRFKLQNEGDLFKIMIRLPLSKADLEEDADSEALDGKSGTEVAPDSEADLEEEEGAVFEEKLVPEEGAAPKAGTTPVERPVSKEGGAPTEEDQPENESLADLVADLPTAEELMHGSHAAKDQMTEQDQ